jgi:hypothetical protein
MDYGASLELVVGSSGIVVGAVALTTSSSTFATPSVLIAGALSVEPGAKLGLDVPVTVTGSVVLSSGELHIRRGAVLVRGSVSGDVASVLVLGSANLNITAGGALTLQGSHLHSSASARLAAGPGSRFQIRTLSQAQGALEVASASATVTGSHMCVSSCRVTVLPGGVLTYGESVTASLGSADGLFELTGGGRIVVSRSAAVWLAGRYPSILSLSLVIADLARVVIAAARVSGTPDIQSACVCNATDVSLSRGSVFHFYSRTFSLPSESPVPDFLLEPTHYESTYCCTPMQGLSVLASC